MKDYAEIARLTGLTRARVTQIVNLTLLAPEIQEELLLLIDAGVERPPILERQMRHVVTNPDWGKQRLHMPDLRGLRARPHPALLVTSSSTGRA